MKSAPPLVLTLLLAAALARADSAPTQFDPKGSDPQAVAAVDKEQAALGMPDAWRKAHYIEFSFGGARNDTVLSVRRHCWDTWTGRYRVEGTSGKRTGNKKFVLIFDNINDPKTVHVWLNGEKQTADTTLAMWGENGHALYINDTYWMFMPYKMKDPGVHLKWLGAQLDSLSGKNCNAVELSFDNVGLTPKDHYDVWIDQATNMVVKWKYMSGENPENTFITPWEGWMQAGPLMLSTKRPHPGTNMSVVMPDPVASDAVNEKMFEGP